MKQLGTLTIFAATLALTFAPLAASAAMVNARVGAEASTSALNMRAGVHASSTERVGARVDARVSDAKGRGDKEIDRRTANLTKLSLRVDDMKRLGASNATTLSASIQAQIDALTALKAKIDADDSTTTLKDDIKSITGGYRVYMLVMPQIAITAAGDRVLTIASLMGQLSTKLSARIDAASTTDKASLQSALTDYNAKVADAKVQAQAAIDAVAVLKPDNGDTAVAASNVTALKAARTKVQAAQQDLITARKDAGTIIKGVGGKVDLKAAMTASTSVQTR